MPDIRGGLRLLLALVALCAATVGFAAPTGPLLLDATFAGESIVTVGERGLIRRSTDGGKTWITSDPVVPYTLCAVSFADARNGWAAGHGAVVLRTTDGGLSWQHQYTGPDPESPFLDLLALDGGHLIAIGAFGSYFVSHDAGATWEQEWILDEDMHLNRITRMADGTLFIAGEMGALLRSSDNGVTWDTLDTGEDGSLYGVMELSDHTLLAYGLRGRVYRSTDRGDSWTAVKTPGTGLLMTGIELGAARTIILAGQARTWWMSRDGGRTFTAPTDRTPSIAEVLLTPAGQLLTFGENGVNPAP
ncbi:WD40/YVTN/BNR-like repeat-containing protein [Actomonas aquatica]|uniref:YCF48-related protein n=1 Tax=Actomonas aquatica TaxID=2866162 RepID=A0ABZ1CBS8_9BACT|nr:YCF48-related protein [Opitutus sp. WL0086]WRQ89016.1 YCF48-related protein [Opitutus sp. WL0086]